MTPFFDPFPGDLRLGIQTEPDYLRIAELFSTLQSQQSQIQLHILQSMTWEALDRLQNDELDAAFIYGIVDSDKIFSMELQQLKLVVVGPEK